MNAHTLTKLSLSLSLKHFCKTNRILSLFVLAVQHDSEADISLVQSTGIPINRFVLPLDPVDDDCFYYYKK